MASASRTILQSLRLNSRPQVLRFMSPMVQLCDLLGLKVEFLDRLQTFPAHHLHHRSLCEWITIFLQNNSRSLSLKKKSSLTLELLDSIGFDPLSTGVETIMARSSKGNAQNHTETCEWAQTFIQDEFKYNHEVSSQNGKFPFRGHFNTNSRSSFPIIEGKNDPER